VRQDERARGDRDRDGESEKRMVIGARGGGRRRRGRETALAKGAFGWSENPRFERPRAYPENLLAVL